MYFLSLVARNVYTRKVRTSLTGLAVAISIAILSAMGVLTHSLELTATSVLKTGKADFTIAQKGVADILYSSIDEKDLAAISDHEEISIAMGLLINPVEYDDNHPFFLMLGLNSDQLEPFGITIVAGRTYDEGAPDEVILGYRAARELNKTVGDTIVLNQPRDHTYTIVGIYSTGEVFGDSASMVPLHRLQADQRKTGVLTMIFVQTKPGADIEAVRRKIEADRPELATVRTTTEFGDVNRNLKLIQAANVAVPVLALVIGAVTILNTMILSVFERTREFGVLRAIGWSRFRVLLCVMSEAVVISWVGAMVGVGLGFLAIWFLSISPGPLRFFQPDYTAGVFLPALGTAFGMAFVGALYPAARAALLRPLEAIRHE